MSIYQRWNDAWYAIEEGVRTAVNNYIDKPPLESWEKEQKRRRKSVEAQQDGLEDQSNEKDV